MSHLSASLERHALAALIVEPDTGIILQSNAAATALCGGGRTGQRLADFSGLSYGATRGLLEIGMKSGFTGRPLKLNVAGRPPRDIEVDGWSLTESRRPLLLMLLRDVSEQAVAARRRDFHERLLVYCTQVDALVLRRPADPGLFEQVCKLAVASGVIAGAQVTLIGANGAPQVQEMAGDVTVAQQAIRRGPYTLKFTGDTRARGELTLFPANPEFLVAEEYLRDHLSATLVIALDARVRADGPTESIPTADVDPESSRLGVFEFRVRNGEGTCNADYGEMLGYEPNAFTLTIGWWQAHVHPDDLSRAQQDLDGLLQGQVTRVQAEFRMRGVDGRYRWIRAAVHATDPDADGRPRRIIGTHTDITTLRTTESAAARQARGAHASLEMPVLAEKLAPRDFLQAGLDIAEEVTDSRIGFLHFVTGVAQDIELITWSSATLKAYCTMEKGSRHYPLAKAGIWADACRTRQLVVVNSYTAHEHRSELPDGHAFLDRFAVVPVIEHGKVVMLMGVGNKKTDYDQVDAVTLQIMADEVWRLYRWRLNESAMRKASQFHHALLGSLDVGVLTCDRDGHVHLQSPVTRRWFGGVVGDSAECTLTDMRRCLYTADGSRPLEDSESPIARALAGEAVNREDIVLKVPGLPDRRCRCTGTHWSDRSGKVVNALVVMHEVTQ